MEHAAHHGGEANDAHDDNGGGARQTTVVLKTGGLNWASEKAIVERELARRPGVVGVDANPVAQTATVTYDPERTTVAELSRWV